MDDRKNTIAGWVLFAGIVALCGAFVTCEYFRAGRAEKEDVFVLGNKSASRQLEQLSAIDLLVEVEIEAVERPIRVPKSGGVDATREKAV